MEPAGEMWSVVTESLSSKRARALLMSAIGCGSGVIPSVKAGRETYVELASHA